MLNKEKILEILQELEDIWDMASWLKSIILLSDNQEIISVTYEIIEKFISTSKIKNIDKIKEKLVNIKKEEQSEKKDQDLEEILDFNF